MEEDRSLGEDAREVAWRFVVGAGVGAIVGLIVGGIGGRLAMLALRLGSPDAVIGATSDDGFTIGIVTAASLFLLMVTAGLGAATGVLYVAVRTALPVRGRALLVGVVAALFMGADLVNPTAFDFVALEPKAFAVAAFTLLPGIAAFTIAVVVERLLLVAPWSNVPLAVVLSVAALVLNVVLVAVAAIAGLALALRRAPGLAGRIRAVARVVLPVALVVVAVRAGVELWRDADALL